MPLHYDELENYIDKNRYSIADCDIELDSSGNINLVLEMEDGQTYELLNPSKKQLDNILKEYNP